MLYFGLQKDDRVCAQLFCFDSGSGYCVAYRPAAEGSPCGDGQVNIQIFNFQDIKEKMRRKRDSKCTSFSYSTV